jgi:hypothetical protein
MGEDMVHGACHGVFPRARDGWTGCDYWMSGIIPKLSSKILKQGERSNEHNDTGQEADGIRA